MSHCLALGIGELISGNSLCSWK